MISRLHAATTRHRPTRISRTHRCAPCRRRRPGHDLGVDPHRDPDGERTETELSDTELLAAYRDRFGIGLDRPGPGDAPAKAKPALG